MIYAAFSVWVLLILFVGIGLCRLWGRLWRPAWVNWALLPGTVVSEMAYIFGCLITGGEIRRARLIDSSSGAGGKRGQGGGGSEPGTEATAGLKFVGPVVASLLAIVACGSAILLAHALLGKPVIDEFRAVAGNCLPTALPDSWNAFWDRAAAQVKLLQRTAETLAGLNWLNWRVPLFVYLAACLSVRLAPSRRDLRATLAAVALTAASIAAAGALSARFRGLMEDIWPLLTYVWASLLLMLTASLIVHGLVSVVGALAGRTSP